MAPATLRGHAAAAAAAGAGLLDTPVSGSVGLAETGKLTIMVGGAAADLERARPVLEALAGTVFHLGPLGTGAAMKLAVNTADLRAQPGGGRGARPRGGSRDRADPPPTTS